MQEDLVLEGEDKSRQGELDLDLHEENPFLAGFRPRIGRRKVSMGGESLSLVDMSTGVVEGTAEVSRVFEVDREQFTKVFQAQMGLFFGLSAPGVKVLAAVWIEVTKRHGQTSVYMTAKTASRAAERAGHTLSRATYFRGRKNLVEAGFIAASGDANIYWINPAVFFNGDRVKLVTELSRPPQIAAPGKSFEGDLS